jgi:hypothetical protein
MTAEIALRNLLNHGSFRLEVTPELWEVLYEVDRKGKLSNIITVKRNGVLRGYASYLTFARGQLTALGVLDMNAEGDDVLEELTEALIQRAEAEGVDIVYFRKTPGPDDRVLDKKGFSSFVETVIAIKLLDPRELLKAFSDDDASGPCIRLDIEGFESITATVGKKGIKLLSETKADLELSTDSETFLKLFFNQTSVMREFLRRRLKTSNISKLLVAMRFFNLIKQEKWYLPFGDWA